jgi:hypothetical protein
MNKNFKIGDVVIIINKNHKYFGERGTVKKITPKMVNLFMKKKKISFRIKKINIKLGASPYIK